MKLRLVQLGVVLLSFLWLGLGGEALAKSPPVAMLTQVKGDVQYSKNGKKWKKVRRNKYLFSGYQIKTGADGSGKLVNEGTQMARKVGSGSVIKITDTGAEMVSGSLSEPEAAGSSLSASLSKRFAKAQRYTTVRRSVNKHKKVKLSTVKSISLSSKYPELVWEDMGSGFSYRLIIDGQVTMSLL